MGGVTVAILLGARAQPGKKSNKTKSVIKNLLKCSRRLLRRRFAPPRNDILNTPKIVLKSLNIVLTQIIADLKFNNGDFFVAEVRQTVPRLRRNVY